MISSRIEWLDGWRAIAVVIVIACHVQGHLLGSFPIYGRLGVYIFFAISGFIVTKLLLRERASQGNIDIGHFFLRRAARILPPLLIYAVFAIAVVPTQDMAETASRALAFTCNLGAPRVCRFEFLHTWSLAFEEQFYIMVPFVLAARPKWPLAIGVAIAILPLAFPVGLIGRLGFVHVYSLLASGALLALYEPVAMPWLARIPLPLTLLCAFFACLWWLLPPSHLHAAFGLALGPLVALVVFAAPMRSEIVRRFLASTPMGSIGLYSYSLYLWQQFALTPNVSWNKGYWLAVWLMGAFVVSVVSFYTIEKWAREWARRVVLVPRGPAVET